MRTVKIINNEAEKALEKYNEHFNDCHTCQHSPTCAEDEITCHEAEWLYEEYETLRSESDYAEQVFQAEFKERQSSQFPTDVETEIYYGTLEINPKILTVVKVISAGILRSRMIQIMIWKERFEKKDWFYGVISIQHTTNSYYKKENLKPGCDEQLFEEIYNNCIKQF